MSLTRLMGAAVTLFLVSPPSPAVGAFPGALGDLITTELHGYGELRGGGRLGGDPHEKGISLMEARMQLELSAFTPWCDFKYKGDAWGDGVAEQARYDGRELWLFSRPLEVMDIKIGRQVLTWGTGDLVFLNDLFPKDWRSFFIGRDAEYLKAPSDAVKIGLFTDPVSIDLVYTPRFDPDRFITGEYVSSWNASLGRRSGRDTIISADTPDRWFKDDEIALRLYGNWEGYELAAYGYQGFWKTPLGRTREGTAGFPRLNVYGASLRGGIGPGIANLEFAWYHSVDRGTGRSPPSELRYLAGYAQEIGRDFTASAQYYVEQIRGFGRYRRQGGAAADRDRVKHVLTVQLTKLLLNQNLKLSLSGYCSPSDRDAYLRPGIRYNHTDRISLEAGANIFFGRRPETFFSQFKDNTSIYGAVRYSF